MTLPRWRRRATCWSISRQPAALEGNLDAAMAAGVPIVVGTTGLEERHHFLCDNAAESIAVLQTGNTSLGVTLLAHLVREAASRLGEDWDIEITETHHRMKVDAPSGTALLLGEAAAKGRGIDLASSSARGRDGITGARKAVTSALRACAAAAWRAITPCISWATTSASRCRTWPKTAGSSPRARCARRSG
jgi:4-hydroxy-tetrahydrodipicolinate reductase